MALQNRVTPFGELVATPARGTMFGNRGGRFHRDDRTLGQRRWASRQWICCVLQFKDRHHPVWRDRYTALFFLDEVTALAAGHRPCFECRRADAKVVRGKMGAGEGRCHSARARDGCGAPDGAARTAATSARTKCRSMNCPMAHSSRSTDSAYAVRGAHLLRWSESGYTERIARPRGVATVLTPPSIVAVLSAGYAPQWHPSAD